MFHFPTSSGVCTNRIHNVNNIYMSDEMPSDKRSYRTWLLQFIQKLYEIQSIAVRGKHTHTQKKVKKEEKSTDELVLCEQLTQPPAKTP
jgi:hypothetical protein